MGLFDIFKKKANKQTQINSHSESRSTTRNDLSENAMWEVATASVKYEEENRNYLFYKEELIDLGFDDEKIIFVTIGIILQFYYASDKQSVKVLFEDLDKDYPENNDITWLVIEVICTINIDNDIEFVQKYLNHKRLHDDFKHQYETEYQKGLELKTLNYFKEAIDLWTNLNLIQEFSWNYYQIGILQNLMNNESCLDNLKIAIEMDEEIKEDAKTYPELDNLRANPEFLELIK